MTWHWQVGVVVCAVGVVGGQSGLVAVVAVGESSEVAGLVGVNGGGGWKGTIANCLVIVADNKASIGFCRRLLWVKLRNNSNYRAYIHHLKQLHSAVERTPIQYIT